MEKIKNDILKLENEIEEMEKSYEEMEEYYMDKPELDRESDFFLDLAYDEIIDKQQEIKRILVLKNNKELAILFNSVTR